MKNFILFSMLFVGLMLTSCSAIQIITEPGTETTPSKTPTSTKTTKKTNKVDMKTTSPKQGTKPRETKVISKPKAKPKSTKSNKSGKVIKKPSKKPTSNTSNNSMSQKQTSKPVVSRTKQAPKRVIKPTPKKGVKARPTKRVVKATPRKRVIKPTTKKAVVHTQKKTVKKVKPKVAKIALDQARYNFGTIKEGTIIKRDFRFTNVGEADLLIEIATGSCGCTVPEWPIKPIKPGQSEVIHVTFDSTDKEYDTRVEVNIVANTEPIVTEIIMTGKVIPKRDFKKKKG